MESSLSGVSVVFRVNERGLYCTIFLEFVQEPLVVLVTRGRAGFLHIRRHSMAGTIGCVCSLN